MGALYRLDFSNGKSYVGITTETALARLIGHESKVRHGSQLAVHSAWRKYGAPQLRVIALVQNADLNECERRAIKVYGTLAPHGYNMTPGGESNPAQVPEIAARISATKTGLKFSKNHRANIAAANRRKPINWSLIERMREANSGIKRSPELKARIAAKLKGRRHSPTSIAKMCAAAARRNQCASSP